MSVAFGLPIGIIGGGQLGRMVAMAARTLGYRVHGLDPDPACSLAPVVDHFVRAGFDDVAAIEAWARGCAVVTCEIEKIAPAALRAAEQHTPVRPRPEVLEVVQDRARQRRWLAEAGLPLGPFRVVDEAPALAEAVRALGGPCFVKAARGGYDGRGQAYLSAPEDAAQAADLFAGGPCVVERALRLERELSVLVARSPSGQRAVYPPALNHHEARVLAWSVLPAPVPAALAARAQDLAARVAEGLDVVGLLAVELFHTVEGELLVNELAPRPHNSYHASEAACETSQFEQHVRAVCDLPLGSTEIVRPAAIGNLLGERWAEGPPALERTLTIPGVHLHLYGKGPARPGRKMGHLLAGGATPDEARARIEAALRALG